MYHRESFSSQGKEARSNIKYVKLTSRGSSYEVIIGNHKGRYYIVKDPVNMGTYNYYDKSTPLKHLWHDVVPYKLWGNTQDPRERYYRRKKQEYYYNIKSGNYP
jgi:hypothetical protein